MQQQGNAVLRSDLAGVLEDALGTDRWFRGAQIAPPLAVDDQAGQYPQIKINEANLLRDVAKPRARGSDYHRIIGQLTKGTYTTDEYGFEQVIDDDDVADNSRFFDLASRMLLSRTRQLQLKHEKLVKDVVFSPSVFPLITSATAYTSANIATFDVADDVENALNEIAGRGENPDTRTVAAIPEAVYRRLKASTRLQNRVRGVASTDTQLNLSDAQIAEALGVGQVYVLRSREDTSKQGASASTLSAIWPNTYIWVGIVDSGTNALDSALRTLFWSGSTPSVFTVEQYREEKVRGEILRVRGHWAVHVANANRGQLIATQYS
jgi:hypothetical protein